MPTSLFYTFLLFFLFTCICIDHASSSSSSSTVLYTKHCSSIVPESSTKSITSEKSVPYLDTSYFTGGDKLLNRKPGNHSYSYYLGQYVRLRILPDYYETVDPNIYKIEGFLHIRPQYSYYDARSSYNSYGGYSFSRSRAKGVIKFSMNGFWSESSRKICMVGSASWNDDGKATKLEAVLKLSYASEINPTIYTGVASGTLESTSSANDTGYFDPILIFSFPDLPTYKYTLVSKAEFSSDFDVPRKQSLSLHPTSFCSVLGRRRTYLDLEYATECREPQRCSPIGDGEGLNGSLPRSLSLSPLQCSHSETKLRFLATFDNNYYADQGFGLGSTFVGEASWDDKKNKLFGVACQILSPADHFGKAVGECKVRLSLRYPSILTIKNDAKIVGQFWSSKNVKDSGYFKKINIKGNYEDDVVDLLEPKYEYTELDKVSKSCPVKKPAKKGNTYPDGDSHDMRFSMNIKNSKGEQFAWGYATPLSVGDDLFRRHDTFVSLSLSESDREVGAIKEPKNSNNTSINISYNININPSSHVNSSSWFPSLNSSMNLHHRVDITAEGVYNAETGYLCMVGCRKLWPYINNSTYVSRDCEILVEFEFPPLNGKGRDLIKGTIKSRRAKTDSLHFDDLIMQSVAYYREDAEQSIWRMDLEIVLVLISNTLTCIVVALQIFHVKRNPEVPSFISLVMLLILSLGHMILLVLNFEAMFLEKHNRQPLFLRKSGRLEAHEVAVRVITLVAFLLQIRLVQLVWTAKQRQGDEKSSWIGEKKSGFVSLSLYILGGLLTLLVTWIRNRSYWRYSVWGDLRSYAGLILDGFLLPQILLNIFRGSAEKALSYPFYIGISVVRLVPHAYNQYRAYNYSKFDSSVTYYYANPAADFYSTAWDIIIPCGVIAFVVIVFLQQRHGGRCILPQRFRALQMYEKVPTVDI